jgi:restriction system protein
VPREGYLLSSHGQEFMAIHFTDEVIKRIELLENPKSLIQAQELDQVYYNIVAPLLTHDGYKVIDRSLMDHGVDIEAVHNINNTSTRLGFQFKHYLRPIAVKEILTEVGRSVLYNYQKMCIVSTSGFTNAAIVKASISPYAIELIDLTFLKSWALRIRTELQKEAVEQYGKFIKSITAYIVKQIIANPFFLDQIEWRELEKTVAELFDGLGFSVELTPPSQDGGKDIILEYKIAGQSKSSIVEVKHWKSKTKVGSKDVVEFVEVVISEKRDSGIYLSTYGYTGNAFATLTEIQRNKLRSSDQRKIYSLCTTYYKAKQGLWAIPEDLGGVLYENTHEV